MQSTVVASYGFHWVLNKPENKAMRTKHGNFVEKIITLEQIGPAW